MRRLIFALSFMVVFSLCQSSITSARDTSSGNNVCMCSLSEYVEYFYVGDQLYKITYYDDGSTTIQAVGCIQGD